VGVLLHEAWHLATHLDGRFWVTLYTLLCKPGVLTVEYFAEHRARFLPPVRLYLVLSLLFFAFNVVAPPGVERAQAPVGAAAPPAPGRDATDAGELSAFRALYDHRCERVHSRWPWFEARAKHACERNATENGAPMRQAFYHNMPKVMFVFVPLSALFMRLLYWRPRRYYVEHLVFFLHNHAALFLVMLLCSLVSGLAALGGAHAVRGWLDTASTLYLIGYVYLATRRYYQQGRIATLAKLALVASVYSIGISLTATATLLLGAVMD
jgi:hypothetical protein